MGLYSPRESELLGTVPGREGRPFCKRYFLSSGTLIIVTNGPVNSCAFLASLGTRAKTGL